MGSFNDAHPPSPPTTHWRPLSSGFIPDDCRQPDNPLIGKEVGTYPNNEDEDGDTDSGVSDDLMIGETEEVPEEMKTYPLNSKVESILASFPTESLNSEGLQKRLRSRQSLSKADEIENKESDDRLFCGGLNSEGLDKRLRCKQMNSKHLDDLESEELDERPMTRKLTKTSSVVDLLQTSGSSKNDSDSESESGTDSKKIAKNIANAKPKSTNNRTGIKLCEDSRVEDSGPTRKTTAVNDDNMSFSNTSDLPPIENSKGCQAEYSNETARTDVVLVKNLKATSNRGGGAMMDAQLSHIANATPILSPLQTVQPVSALNKGSRSLFINFGGTCIYTANMNTFNANKLVVSGPINFLLCREVCLFNAQHTTKDGQNIFLSTDNSE